MRATEYCARARRYPLTNDSMLRRSSARHMEPRRVVSASEVMCAGEFMHEVCGLIIRPSPWPGPNLVANMPIAVFLPRADSSIDALAFDVQAGTVEPLHVHPQEALLIYAEAGAYNLFTEDCVWALLPSRAIW